MLDEITQEKALFHKIKLTEKVQGPNITPAEFHITISKIFPIHINIITKISLSLEGSSIAILAHQSEK